MDLQVMFDHDLVVPLPDGTSISFPANEWVFFKPKWATTFPMGDFIAFAYAHHVNIKDVNNDIWHTGVMEQTDAIDMISKNLSWVARFCL